MKQILLTLLAVTLYSASAQVVGPPPNQVAANPPAQTGAQPATASIQPGSAQPVTAAQPVTPALVAPVVTPAAVSPQPVAGPPQAQPVPQVQPSVASQPQPAALPQPPAPVVAPPQVNATSTTANSTVVNSPASNSTTLPVNVTAPTMNATAPLQNLTLSATNATSVVPTALNSSLPIPASNNVTQTNSTSPISNHVNVMSVESLNVAASQNGTLLSLNETHSVDILPQNVTNISVSQLNTTALVNNSTTLSGNATVLTLGPNITIALNNSTESVILSKTIVALNNAADNTNRLIQDVSNEISWIQTNLPLRSNNLTISISQIGRRIRELFLNTSPHFASYYIADLQHFSATVEKLVATIGKNISELYEDFSQTVTLHIMNTTTLIADTATNISRMLKNATEGKMNKVCITRLTPQVMAYGEHYINILGACSTDQEARVKAIASNTMITCSSLFAQGLEIVKKLNDCMDSPSVSVNASRICVTDVCSQLPLAALNIEMDALMIQAGITFDIETLRDRVTYCSLMRSVEATNKANILMQMSSLCLAGRLK